MTGKEKDKLANAVSNYFTVASRIKDAANQLKSERENQAENETVEPIHPVEPVQSEPDQDDV